MANYMILILLLTLISSSFCLNCLFISVGAAGHIIPIFELAKTMKNNHNITFLTHQSAQSYINLKSYASPLFRILFTNDSSNALMDEKTLEQKMLLAMTNRSLLDAAPDIIPIFGAMGIPLLNKTIDLLTHEQFDVIIAGVSAFGISLICNKIRTPCVIHSPALIPDMRDFNLPNIFSMLTSKQLTQLKYRIYNAMFSVHIITRLVLKLSPVLYRVFNSLPQISGPFYDTFTIKNIFSSKSKYLSIVSMPSTFFTPSYPDHYKKYLGAFIDETPINNTDKNLTKWIQMKENDTILYGAFGSSSIISYHRMYNLINGLAMFLLETEQSYALLAFRSINYDTYQTVLNNLENEQYRSIIKDKERVRIENGFVQQKWILQQNNIKLFLSHCGMGSALEALYFSNPILCMPFTAEQFSNAIRIDDLGVGQSLFVPPSLWSSFINPYNFFNYTFTSRDVRSKLMTLWLNEAYKEETRQMSLEMKHAGGVKRAAKEIEFFVNRNGDLDRFAPFPSILPFYQRFKLDLLLIFIILPGILIFYLTLKCCKRRQRIKPKKD